MSGLGASEEDGSLYAPGSWAAVTEAADILKTASGLAAYAKLRRGMGIGETLKPGKLTGAGGFAGGATPSSPTGSSASSVSSVDLLKLSADKAISGLSSGYVPSSNVGARRAAFEETSEWLRTMVASLKATPELAQTWGFSEKEVEIMTATSEAYDKLVGSGMTNAVLQNSLLESLLLMQEMKSKMHRGLIVLESTQPVYDAGAQRERNANTLHTAEGVSNALLGRSDAFARDADRTNDPAFEDPFPPLATTDTRWARRFGKVHGKARPILMQGTEHANTEVRLLAQVAELIRNALRARAQSLAGYVSQVKHALLAADNFGMLQTWPTDMEGFERALRSCGREVNVRMCLLNSALEAVDAAIQGRGERHEAYDARVLNNMLADVITDRAIMNLKIEPTTLKKTIVAAGSLLQVKAALHKYDLAQYHMAPQYGDVDMLRGIDPALIGDTPSVLQLVACENLFGMSGEVGTLTAYVMNSKNGVTKPVQSLVSRFVLEGRPLTWVDLRADL